MKHFAPILALLLVPTLAIAQELSDEQVNDLKTVRATLDAENPALAKELATRVLGREVQG